MRVKGIVLGLACVLAAADRVSIADDFRYLNPSVPIDERVKDLVSRMSLAEKISQLGDLAPAIPRLKGMTPYRWTNEALHGLGGVGPATGYPQAIALAATWDPELVRKVGDQISTEARALYLSRSSSASCSITGDGLHRCPGLTFYTPVINIARDPRWGRNQETYGEDPRLSAAIASAMIRGLQGDPAANHGYLKTAAVLKHFAVHSGPEIGRRAFEPQVRSQDLWSTYLPAFESTIAASHPAGVMCAYNSLFGEPLCANRHLLQEVLRGRMGFDGFVVSDCNAIDDMITYHHWHPPLARAAGEAIHAGTDLACRAPGTLGFSVLGTSVSNGEARESDVDLALSRLLKVRMKLGLFDPQSLNPWSSLRASEVGSPEHRQLAVSVAVKGLVLLKNNGALPFKTRFKRIAVIGPNALSLNALLGAYAATPTRADANLGADFTRVARPIGVEVRSATRGTEALALLSWAEAVVFASGLTFDTESELVDRTQIELPTDQKSFLGQVRANLAAGKPLVLVNFSGAPISFGASASSVDAIVQAFYPGQEGGTAIAQVLLGTVSPSGRLPMTSYRTTAELPDFSSYFMAGRTYRFMSKDPEYAFGYGLSYSRFKFESLEVPDAKQARVKVTNLGPSAGTEIAQLYVSAPSFLSEMGESTRLISFSPIELAAGESRVVVFSIPERALDRVDSNGDRKSPTGALTFKAGGHSGQYVPPEASELVSNVVSLTIAAERLGL